MTLTICSGFAVSNFSLAKETRWYDTFYQYRIPVTVDVEQTGWNVVPVNESDITSAINDIDQFTFDPIFLAYNQVLLVDNTTGQKLPDAGFYCIPKSAELVREQGVSIAVPTRKNQYYLVSYRAAGNKGSPLASYHQPYPMESKARPNKYLGSYGPRILPRTEQLHEHLLLSDGTPLKILQTGHTVKASAISARQVRIKLLAYFDKPGRKQLSLYYQPLCSHYLKIPKLRMDTTPDSVCSTASLGTAEKYSGSTRYTLVDNSDATVWFAETTVKLKPETPPPAARQDAIDISCAQNEAQSFQIVLNPKKGIVFESVDIIGLPGKEAEIYQLDYVPISKRSFLTPAALGGMVGDPLVPLQPKQLNPYTGNQVLFFTIRTTAETKPGGYNAKIRIQYNTGAVTVPLRLTVYDFALPEYSPLQASMGGQYFATPAAGGKTSLLEFHGLSTRAELKKLSNAYFDIMARNKFFPKSVLMYTAVPFDWKAPPQGYNVDKPDNFFELSNFDFSEMNTQLARYIDQLKVNSVCLTNTNPRVSNLFKHLPGKPRADGFEPAGHMTMGNQFFNEKKLFTWGKRETDAYAGISTEISVKQFDRLLLDYYRAFAANLKKHGWIDKCYIYFDYAPDIERIRHLVKLLKSDPLTREFKIVVLMQDASYFTYDEGSDTEFSFGGSIVYEPNICESYNFWEPYNLSDYNIVENYTNLWNRPVTSARFAIDCPGVTNRIIGLDLFRKKASGYLMCETIAWDYRSGQAQNPWQNPYVRFGNGAMAYFYPPSRIGVSPVPDWTIIPSIRVMTFRESVDDYEYAFILANLIEKAADTGIDTSRARAALSDIDRFFVNSVSWSQNDAWYLELRERIAREIVDLKTEIELK